MRELELRGRLSKEEYLTARNLLSAQVQGVKNDKLSQFFDFERGILKVSHHESSQTTILSLKIGDETKNNLHEQETVLGGDTFDKCVDLIEALGYKKRELVKQIREDFNFDAIVISLKFTDDWGYHFEAEIMLDDDTDEEPARRELNKICQHFGLRPMTSKELDSFLESIKR